MALYSLGRNAVVAASLERLAPDPGESAEQVRAKANEKLDDVREGLLGTLAPWIPGDFVVTYGALLTAWGHLQGSFRWMLVVAASSAFTFVVLGAFASSGFRSARQRSVKVRNQLIVRTISGFFVSVYASVAIPMSGWHDFEHFRDNELSWVVTAGIVAVALTLLLKGLQKRLGYRLSDE